MLNAQQISNIISYNQKKLSNRKIIAKRIFNFI